MNKVWEIFINYVCILSEFYTPSSLHKWFAVAMPLNVLLFALPLDLWSIVRVCYDFFYIWTLRRQCGYKLDITLQSMMNAKLSMQREADLKLTCRLWGIVSIVFISPFLWQCQNPCILSLAFIIDWGVVPTLLPSLLPSSPVVREECSNMWHTFLEEVFIVLCRLIRVIIKTDVKEINHLWTCSDYL